jgi:cell division protein FtsQ
MWDDARQMNATALVLALFAIAMFAWGVGSWLVRQPVFAFREVVINGPLQRASAPHLEAIIRDELAGTFFTMNLDRARASLRRVPWVRSVALRRQWPQRLEVTVEEHTPFARWNDAALVNPQGEVFVATYNGELPLFAGPEGRSADVAARFREWTAMLGPVALSIQRIALSPRGGWQLVTRGAAGALQIELGREEPAARLQRFIAVHGRTLGALERAGTRIEHVDLRYRSGFAARVPGFREKAPKRAPA